MSNLVNLAVPKYPLEERNDYFYMRSKLSDLENSLSTFYVYLFEVKKDMKKERTDSSKSPCREHRVIHIDYTKPSDIPSIYKSCLSLPDEETEYELSKDIFDKLKDETLTPIDSYILYNQIEK